MDFAQELGVGAIAFTFAAVVAGGLVEVLGDALLAAQRGDAVLATQPFEHDADLVLGREAAARGSTDIPDGLLGAVWRTVVFVSHRYPLGAMTSSILSLTQSTQTVRQLLTAGTSLSGLSRPRRSRVKAIQSALMGMFVMAATDRTENIALSRNEVIRTSDARIWRGTFWNHSDSLYTDLDTVVLFLDKDGRPVGQAQGAAERLDPGETFHLESPLPAEAVRMQVYQMRWTTNGRHRAVLGPYRSWSFGYVMDTECGDLRLKIGSCVPQRERT